jgi:Ca2+-transporting ATPase
MCPDRPRSRGGAIQPLADQHWHALPTDEVADLLETDAERGLDLFTVKHRVEQFGPNSLTPPKGVGPLKRFALQFADPLVVILLAAGIVTLVLRDWVDAIVIVGVVLLNAIVGYVQEARAVAAIDALARAMTTEATVLRAGEQLRLPAPELVPGDLVLLQAGDKVPADLRLVRTRELRVDESALTGESVPVEKGPGVVDRERPLAERTDMAYASALVTYGTGHGLVVATGDVTEVGRINQLIAEARDLKTPLTRKIDEFSKVLLVVILGLAAFTFAVGLFRGEELVDLFKASIALAVAAIPEGLPAAVTITLAIGVNRMARRRAIIRKLPAVEALGSTTVICTDKTGTLTENQMTVQRTEAGGQRIEVTGGGYGPEGGLEPAPGPAVLETLRAGLLCNDAALSRDDDGRWQVAGDPTEGALITSAIKAGLLRETEEARLPRLDAIPFESEHQYMATLHATAAGGRVAYLKGAVEKVLARCEVELDAGGARRPLDEAAVQARVEELAADGLRVLAFASKELPAGQDAIGHDDVAEGLAFLGLQAMIDPPRAEAVAAVKACQTAGVTVKMITGDHAVTAAAIAAQIGLAQPGGAAVTGAEMAALRDKELIEVAAGSNVFARVTPEQKLRLVEALQARKNVVAMTGDGVNDAPALKQADIGVAMGITGTDVAKEAADMVLTDDNFASIEAAVEEGRGVFDNLVKFIAYALPTNVGQGLVLLTGIVLGTVLPILPLQILWINMTTAVLLGLGLAFEPKEPGIMQRPPRAPGSPILSRSVVERIVLMGLILLAAAFGLFEWAQSRGLSDAEARTVAVNTFMSVQLFYLFASRSLRRSLFTFNPFSNRFILLGMAVTVLLQALFTYAPFMNVAFDTAPIGGTEWLAIIGAGLAAMVLMDLGGVLRRRVGKGAAD